MDDKDSVKTEIKKRNGSKKRDGSFGKETEVDFRVKKILLKCK
jgi:hypothetical protein